jgi:selenium metabolism protein YedF
MTKILDGFGKACPMPLIMAKKEIDAGCRDLAVQVDNDTAVKNLTRLAKKSGLKIACDVIEGGWLMSFSEGDGVTEADEAIIQEAISQNSACSTSGGCGYAVFVNKDHVGDGDPELGYNLIKMALYTLSESDDVPASLLFMNTGVKLVAGDEPQIIDSVKALEEKGTEVLVCGTCLDFYGVKDALKVGEVSNMYDILGRMQEASKVITL